MKKVFLCAILASLSYPAIASSLQDQLSAVAEAEQQGKNEEQRQHDEWVAERNREIQQEKQRRAMPVPPLTKERQRQRQIRKLVRINWTPKPLRTKTRSKLWRWATQLRDSETKLALAKEEARVKRENEFIDQELKHKAAQTDVVQSEADANRNMTEGGRDLMKSVGKAEENKSESWFN